MKLNEILTLLNAGYTKDEIEALDHTEDTLPDQTPADVPAQIQTDEAVRPSEAEPASVPADDRYNELLDAFNRLTSSIQQSNIAHSHIEGSDAGRTAKDALAEILVPPRKERKR